MAAIHGLHHVTAIAGPAQENLDFYAQTLGMRLVKKSVNQDEPDTYHLFYADAAGHPGTDITFFPWAGMAPSRSGYGLSTEVSLAVPPGSLDYWAGRFAEANIEMLPRANRFGNETLTLADPHGLRLALVASESAMARPFAAWAAGPVPAEFQIRGLEGARMLLRETGPSARFLKEALGFRLHGEEGGWERYAVGAGGFGTYVDLRAAPDERRGAWGTGSVHHLAWRADDLAHQQIVREQVAAAGAQPTPVIDRFWFRSVYFREPGGVLFEVATDGPGFGVDEDPAHLGEKLVLPPWLETNRKSIEHVLPKLTAPVHT